MELVLLAIIFILGVLIFSLCKSTFTAVSESKSIKPEISKDSVLIFFAPWCGHCTNSKPEFEDAVARGNGKVVMIDATNDDNKDLVKKYSVSAFPTIVKGDNTKFSGSRNAEEILDFVNK